MDGRVFNGGCEECFAETEIEICSEGVVVMHIKHDDDCVVLSAGEKMTATIFSNKEEMGEATRSIISKTTKKDSEA
jgi:hypothetical protein